MVDRSKANKNFWSEADIELLRSMYHEGRGNAHMARTLGRTINAVEGALHRHGIRGRVKIAPEDKTGATEKRVAPSMPYIPPPRGEYK